MAWSSADGTGGQTSRQGGCQCGAVRFSSEGEAGPLYICHCRECQKQSASAFGMSLRVSKRGLRILSGTVSAWTRPTDSGGSLDCAFCPACGTRLWHDGAGAAEMISLKAGCLDKPVDASGAIHIWTTRKLAGVVIPDGALSYPEEPPA